VWTQVSNGGAGAVSLRSIVVGSLLSQPFYAVAVGDNGTVITQASLGSPWAVFPLPPLLASLSRVHLRAVLMFGNSVIVFGTNGTQAMLQSRTLCPSVTGPSGAPVTFTSAIVDIHQVSVRGTEGGLGAVLSASRWAPSPW
jgi:hypothetical protein